MTKKEYLKKRMELVPLAVTGYRAMLQLIENSLVFFSDQPAIVDELLESYDPKGLNEIVKKLVEAYKQDSQMLNDIIIEENHNNKPL